MIKVRMINDEDFGKFDSLNDKYLPSSGEGENMATQIVTAVCKLVYKWFNDGDVYDNSYGMEGWCNDLSSYANWLYENVIESRRVLDQITECHFDDEYETILMELSEKLITKENLEKYEKLEKYETIYECDGPFKFEEYSDEEDEDWY